MPEIEFFGTDHEIAETATWLLDQQCVFVPDLHYESKVINQLTELAEIVKLSATIPHFFVLREDFVESPLFLREVSNADSHFFYIDPRTGGPSLQFYWGRSGEKEGYRHLSASWLSYYGWYEDSRTGDRKKPSKNLVSVYSAFAKLIKGSFRKIQPGKREYRISPSAESLVGSGGTLIGLEGIPSEQILGAMTNP